MPKKLVRRKPCQPPPVLPLQAVRAPCGSCTAQGLQMSWQELLGEADKTRTHLSLSAGFHTKSEKNGGHAFI